MRDHIRAERKSVTRRIKACLVAILLLPAGSYALGAMDTPTAGDEPRSVGYSSEPTGRASAAEPVSAVELGQFLENWLKAWGSGDVDGYLAHYVANESPISGLSRQEWEKQRHRMVTPGRHIQISIELDSMGIDDQDSIDVIFLQRFTADGYHDVTRKQIFLVRQADGLKIIREKVLD